MLTSDPIDGGFTSSTLQLNGDTGTNLRTAGVWARFVGIVGLIFGGLFAVGVIIAFLGSLFMGGDDLFGVGAGSGMLSLIMIFYLAVIVFSVYLAWLSFDFGRRSIQSVDRGDQLSLDQAFVSLKRLYICTGGLLILYLFATLGFVLVGFVGLA